MPEYAWRSVGIRFAVALLCGIFLITVLTLGPHSFTLQRQLAPCPSADWHFVISFIIVFSLALALVESLNWLGWFITRDWAAPSDLMKSLSSLLRPGGWPSFVLVFSLLAIAFFLRSSDFCEPFHFGPTSFRDFVAVFFLAYGVFILIQV
jgi:hypothetical protein